MVLICNRNEILQGVMSADLVRICIVCEVCGLHIANDWMEARYMLEETSCVSNLELDTLPFREMKVSFMGGWFVIADMYVHIFETFCNFVGVYAK